MELSKLAFAFCTLATYFFWYKIPQDINLSIIIPTHELKRPLPANASPPIREPVPLIDMADHLRRSWSLTVMPHLGFKRSGPQSRPIKRIPNDRPPQMHMKIQIIIALITTAYSGVHVGAWNFAFHSTTEKWLWRVSTLIRAGATVSFWLFDQIERYHADKYLHPKDTNPSVMWRLRPSLFLSGACVKGCDFLAKGRKVLLQYLPFSNEIAKRRV